MNREQLTVAEIRAGIAAGTTSAAAIVADAIGRIEQRDGGPDGLHALIRTNHQATETARRIDEELRASAPVNDRPLAGVPIVVKDNIDTVELGCTAGSVLLRDVPVVADAPVVTALSDAGAVIVGKANLSEWANFRSHRSVSGWSSAGGQTVNPVAPGRTPCGSSSGSAAAVAAGYVPVAIGTETDGSIICPAATMGLVGFKPTIGRVSQEGIVPIAWSQDSAGPITRTVADTWSVARVLDGTGSGTIEPAALSGARIGIFPPGESVHPATMELYRQAHRMMQEAGALLVPLDPYAEAEPVETAEWLMLQWEFLHAIERYLAERRPGSPWRTLGDLHRANLDRADEILVHFGQDIWDSILDAVQSGSLTEDVYREALATVGRSARREGIDRWFADLSLDVVVAPANGPAWVIDTVNGDRYTGTATPPSAPAGYPVLTVPMGTVSDLPVGLGFYAPADCDERLFRFGFAWEQLTADAALRA